MPLDATDTLTVRRRTSASTDEISDTVMDAIYDSASLGNSSLNLTTYHVIVELLGVLAGLVDKSNEVDSLSISSSQRYDHIRDTLLPLWASINGIGTGGATLTVSNTNTYRTDSLQAEEPTYVRGTATLGYEE